MVYSIVEIKKKVNIKNEIDLKKQLKIKSIHLCNKKLKPIHL